MFWQRNAGASALLLLLLSACHFKGEASVTSRDGQRHQVSSYDSWANHTLTIVNATDGGASVYWIGFDGKAVFYRLVGPHQSYQQPTPRGYKWRALIERRSDPIDYVMPSTNATWTLK